MLQASELWNELGGSQSTLAGLTVTGSGDLDSIFAVTDLATSSIAIAALAIAELIGNSGGEVPRVTIDRRLASFWFAGALRPIGWNVPPAWDVLAGDYRTRDGWIRLHTNAPRHRAAADQILGQHLDKASMSKAVARWLATDLETEVVNAGGCAAEMRSRAAWAAHPQGKAVNSEALIATVTRPAKPWSTWRPSVGRPLYRLRVLDLTRVLAGPVASRFLAGYGADVLRIDPPGWEESGLVPEVTLGKRCARLDLADSSDRRIFEDLLAQADVLLHGYRPGALDGLGYGSEARQKISPDLVDVSLNAYGWTGPWAGRRGFDSLVQMSTGIAEAGMAWRGVDMPVPLPVQALDHATGYLMAAQAIRSISNRLTEGEATTACLSLARCAKLLTDHGEFAPGPGPDAENDSDLAPQLERTYWGDAHRLRPPVEIEDAPIAWDYPASPLGSAAPKWR